MQDFDLVLLNQKLTDGSFTVEDIQNILKLMETEKATVFFEILDQVMLLHKNKERLPLTASEMEQIVNQIFDVDH